MGLFNKEITVVSDFWPPPPTLLRGSVTISVYQWLLVNIYIYIYVYVCMYVSIYLSIYLSISLSLSIYIYIYIHTYVHISVSFDRERVTSPWHAQLVCELRYSYPCPCPQSSTHFLQYPFVLQTCSTNCLGHGHGYEYHSPVWMSVQQIRPRLYDFARRTSKPTCMRLRVRGAFSKNWISTPTPNYIMFLTSGCLVVFTTSYKVLTILQTIYYWGWLTSRGGSFPLYNCFSCSFF